MATRRIFIAICCFTVLGVTIPRSGFGDRIVLKDGSVEISDRIWETEKYVHFILKGTQAVEVRYAKEIVARIERQAPSRAPEGRAAAPVAPAQGKRSPQPDSTVKADLEPQGAALARRPPIPAKGKVIPDRHIVAASRQISFYDPHRPKKYWITRDSRYASLQDALKALAALYGQPVEWVTAHMGDENDLGSIHANLITALNKDQQGSETAPPGISTPQFYDAGRSAALSESDRPAAARQAMAWPDLKITADLLFYDPRRQRKYWTHPDRQFDRLRDAIQALAVEYGVSQQWIETHMGDTNVLREIHTNIRQSLGAAATMDTVK